MHKVESPATDVPDYADAARSHRILLAVDGSQSSRQAALFVQAFFDQAKLDVLGINVTEMPRTWITNDVGFGDVFPLAFPNTEGIEFVRPPEESLEYAKTRARQALLDTGLDKAEVIARMGDPVDAIIRAANDYDVSLIVVGADDEGLLTRLFDRSVTRGLLDHARRPLLVVPKCEPGPARPAVSGS